MSGTQQPLRPARAAGTPTSRLPSYRPIRDLTLGGGTTTVSSVSTATSSATANSATSTSHPPSTRPKFTPNLAAAGRRQAPVETVTAPATDPSPAKRGRGSGHASERGGRGRGRGGRGRGANNRRDQEIIQSKGIFSEGLAEAEAKSRNVEHEGVSFSRRRNDEPRERSKLKDGVKTEALETDEEAMKNLLKCGFLSDLVYDTDRVKPVTLPLNKAAAQSQLQPKVGTDGVPVPDVDLKPDISTIAAAEIKPNINARDAVAIRKLSLPPAFDELYNNGDEKSGDGRLFFVQLPNILAETLVTTGVSRENATISEPSIKEEPMEIDGQQHPTCANGLPVKKEPDIEQVESAPPESTPDAPKRPKQSQHTLAKVPHGRIGKLQLLKSGRVQLKLNEAVPGKPLVFDATPGAKTSFLQQAVVIKTGHHGEPAEEKGDLYVLGDVDHRLVLTPKIDSLLANLKHL